jgi:predicted SAM-dependent methyltransferase
MSDPIRLNIGAGDTVIEGFTAIDRKFGTEAYPLSYATDSVEEIRCVHMLEHLSYREVPEALKEWHRVLKPGGVLRVSVPDAIKVAGLSQSDPNWRFYMMGGQTDENDFHKSCFDEDFLASYLEQGGFENVKRWTSKNTDLAASDFSLNLEGRKPIPDGQEAEVDIKIRAVIGMPRIGWNDSWQSIQDAMHPLGIPIETHQGCFWGQNIQKAMNRAVRDGIDWLITLDYDSMILPMHVNRLLQILGSYPEIDAIAALQMRRGAETPLFSTGKTSADIDGSPIKVNTAHFGLTVLRVECLKNMPKPWLIDIPDKNGDFDGDHTDADITFWLKWKEAGHTVYVAPDVKIGHLELLVSEFDEECQPRHFHVAQWWNRHAKAGHCMRSKKE